MHSNSIIQTILAQLEKDIKNLGATSYRIIYFNLTESTQKDGCYDTEAILSTDIGTFRFTYCLCENNSDYEFCKSNELKISW